MRVLVTGAAGFIGSHVSKLLLARGDTVIGLDNLNDYYSVQLKEDRLAELNASARFELSRMDLADREAVESLFRKCEPDAVVHLAAQAGVRHSLSNPHIYVSSNVTGFLHVLEGCRTVGAKHLVYASTSSVYGANTHMPFSTHRGADHPLTLYAATKRSNELMAHCYSHLFGIPTTGLRFFTVYGPWGRPDMALFLFVKAILEGRPIDIFNNGEMSRDFTYVDDIAAGVVHALDRPAVSNPNWDSHAPDPATSNAPFRLYNIGNSKPTNLLTFVAAIEQSLGLTAVKNFLPMQPGDVPATWADVTDLVADIGYEPRTSVESGVQRFVDWYRAYYLR